MRWGLVCVLVLAAGAGCNALGAAEPGTPTQELTPAPVPTETPTPTAGRPTVAPGVSTTGIENSDRLLANHIRTVRNTSWVWTATTTVAWTADDATTVSVRNQTVSTRNQTVWYVDRHNYRRTLHWQTPGTRGRKGYEQFADGAAVYEAEFLPLEGHTRYRRNEDPRVGRNFSGFATRPIRKHLALESATVSRVDVGSRQHYRVAGSRTTVPNYDSASTATYRVRAVVRADGFVRRLNVTYTVETADSVVRGQYEFAYSRVGNATVEPPDWLDAARDRAGSCEVRC